MDFGLKDKTVLVTAASKGLGYATALAFATEGARVMISSRSESSLSEAVHRIMNDTGNAQVHFCAADLRDREAIHTLFDATESHFGGVDVLINNAGGPTPGNFDEVGDEDWQEAFELSLMSLVRCTERALPYMRKNRWGRIVNFTSSSMKQPVDNLVLSNTFRTAVMGLAKNLANDLGNDNILVNTLGPGRIATERVVIQLDGDRARRLGISVEEARQRSESQIPLGRYGEPDEFAAIAVFLGSAANGYITGQSILVDGGMVRSL